MGKTRGFGSERCEAGCECRRHRANAGSFNFNKSNLDAGAGTRFERKHPLPSIGDRFGELTVVELLLGAAGGPSPFVMVQCSCGAPPHRVYDYNLRKGASTRCRKCGQQYGQQKRWWRYSEVMPEDDHRTRLLNRLGAARTRCTSPKDGGWDNYGGRGIRVCDEWLADKAAFLKHVRTLPGWDDPSLDMDRRDTNGHYEPGNIRFVTRRQNQSTRRTVAGLQAEVDVLREENADLRSRLCRAEAPLHSALV